MGKIISSGKIYTYHQCNLEKEFEQVNHLDKDKKGTAPHEPRYIHVTTQTVEIVDSLPKVKFE